MTDLTPERIAELRRLHEAATQGGWEISKRNDAFIMPAGSPLDGVGSAVFSCQVPNSPGYRNDAKAIVAYHNSFTALLDAATELLALRQRVGDYHAALTHMRYCASCAEGDWADCEEGQKALDLLTTAALETKPTPPAGGEVNRG